ncbi:hypothetical protein TNCV_1804691 [Trichonephila clavipes]|nr:hypothetical protein TNCV_1804691 [Trichonephila clavipes]
MKGMTNCLLKASLASLMVTITVQHMSYEVQLQRNLLYQLPTVGEESLPDSKLVLAENGRGVNDFRI